MLHLVATKFIRPVGTHGRACLVESNDNQSYVVKLFTGPANARALVSDLFISLLYRELQLPVPHCGTITLPRDILSTTGGSTAGLCCRLDKLVLPGTHFATWYPGSTQGVVFDFLPDPMLRRLELPHAFLDALIADVWTGTNKARQAVFTRSNRSFRPWLIGNSVITEGSVVPSTTAPAYPFRVVYERASSPVELQPMLARISRLPVGKMFELGSKVPREWLVGEGYYFDQLITSIILKQNDVESAVLSFIERHPDLFVGWSHCELLAAPATKAPAHVP